MATRSAQWKARLVSHAADLFRRGRPGALARHTRRLAWRSLFRLAGDGARTGAGLCRAASSNRRNRSGLHGRAEYAAPDPRHGCMDVTPRRSRHPSACTGRRVAHAPDGVERGSLAQTLPRASRHRYPWQPRNVVPGRERRRVARRLSHGGRGLERRGPDSAKSYSALRRRAEGRRVNEGARLNVGWPGAHVPLSRSPTSLRAGGGMTLASRHRAAWRSGAPR